VLNNAFRARDLVGESQLACNVANPRNGGRRTEARLLLSRSYHVSSRPAVVIKEDRAAAGASLAVQRHHDLEILTFVLDGSLGYRDSLGNLSVLGSDDVQCISTGCGTVHCKDNASPVDTVHFIEICIEPSVLGVEPTSQQKRFESSPGRLHMLASGDRADGSLHLHQDARIYRGLFDGDDRSILPVRANRRLFTHVIRGVVTANGSVVGCGGTVVTREPWLVLERARRAEVLVLDLPSDA
jgi:quercetin 2,3-dioxygenase